jgi:hypothetical protein
MAFYLFFIHNFGVCYIQPVSFEGTGNCPILLSRSLYADGYIGTLPVKISRR